MDKVVKVRFNKDIAYSLPNGERLQFREGDEYDYVFGYMSHGAKVAVIKKPYTMAVVVEMQDLEFVDPDDAEVYGNVVDASGNKTE
jgi:hypothetical protein